MDKKISQLKELQEAQNEDLFVIYDVEGNETKRIKKENLSFVGLSQSFTVEDWTLSGDYYEIISNHNLEGYVTVEIYQDNSIVKVHSIERIDNNNIKIKIPADPELRFSGTILINK